MGADGIRTHDLLHGKWSVCSGTRVPKLRGHARDHDPRSEFERFLLKFSAMTDQGADGSAVTAKAILGSPYATGISLCS